MLLILSFLLSAGIITVSGYQARRLFGSLERSLVQLTRIGRGVAGVSEQSQFLQWLKDWPVEDAGLASSLVKRIRRVCAGSSLNGWILDPEAWCDGREWLQSESSYDRIQAMPGMLTGIGILFTFLGLMIGIFGLDPTDPERLTQGVRGLLGGMSMAFLTSIAGIGSALWWTWRAKAYAERYQSQAGTICNALQEKPFFTLPDELPNRMLEKMSLQTQYLAELETTMAIAFRKALEDQGWVGIQEGIARMLSRKDGSEILADHLKKVTSNTDGLVGAVRQLVDTQQKLLTAFENQKGGSGSGEAINWENPEERTAFLRDTQALAGNVARIHGSQNQVNDQLLATAASLKELMENARIANADIMITHKQLSNHLQQLEKHWEGYREQVLEMQKSLRIGIETFQNRLQQSLKTAHGEIDELLGESLTHFTAALDSFEGTIEGFGLLLKTGQVSGKKGKWLDKLNP